MAAWRQCPACWPWRRRAVELARTVAGAGGELGGAETMARRGGIHQRPVACPSPASPPSARRSPRWRDGAGERGGAREREEGEREEAVTEVWRRTGEVERPRRGWTTSTRRKGLLGGADQGPCQPSSCRVSVRASATLCLAARRSGRGVVRERCSSLHPAADLRARGRPPVPVPAPGSGAQRARAPPAAQEDATEREGEGGLELRGTRRGRGSLEPGRVGSGGAGLNCRARSRGAGRRSRGPRWATAVAGGASPRRGSGQAAPAPWRGGGRPAPPSHDGAWPVSGGGGGGLRSPAMASAPTASRSAEAQAARRRAHGGAAERWAAAAPPSSGRDGPARASGGGGHGPVWTYAAGTLPLRRRLLTAARPSRREAVGQRGPGATVAA
ncbi:spidroin-1-like [Panicum virgatum]|uniref:spidroin-1-like n=1 Tax=Panicum virgatum TaxID=38727 RepID=UPI0019D62FB0|nr:spidroin-1-like [Panicum virgatum]